MTVDGQQVPTTVVDGKPAVTIDVTAGVSRSVVAPR
jgi:hypothetical protein